MYDPTPGRWLTEDPIDFEAGDADLYRYVGNNPTNAIDPTGLETAANYKRRSGVGDAIAKRTMVPDDDIMGEAYNAYDWANIDIPLSQEVLSFRFKEAYKGISHNPAVGAIVNGVYVNIAIDIFPRHSDKIQVIQIARFYTKVDGKRTTVKPYNKHLLPRSGWDTPDAPSRGWFVDRAQGGTSPFYIVPEGKFIRNGSIGGTTSGNQKTVMFDAPSGWLRDRSTGVEFWTCVIGINDERATFLGCLHWGYYINDSGDVNFDPKPKAYTVQPDALGHAIERWNTIPGLKHVDLLNVRGTSRR